MPALQNQLTVLVLTGLAGAVLVSHVSAEPPKSVDRSKQMKIEIASKSFTAILEDNATARAFKALLPMTVDMSELNGNEKYFRLSDNLPTNPLTPRMIQSGDLMLYGPKTVVLFYKTFQTSYDYTRIGRIADPSGLAAAVGSGSVTVTFELE